LQYGKRQNINKVLNLKKRHQISKTEKNGEKQRITEQKVEKEAFPSVANKCG